MTGIYKSVGMGIGDNVALQEFLRLAKLAERNNFQSLWVQEGNRRSTLTLSANALQATNAMTVGTGVTSPFRRHPQILAIETATLNELSNGRFVLGIGVAEGSITNYGLRVKPIEAMKDAFAIIRGVLTQQAFTYQGKVFQLNNPQETLSTPQYPVYMGAIGPKMLQLAGELADGLIISRRAGFSIPYTKYAIERVIDAAKKKGRDPSKIDHLAFFETSISEDGALAKNFAKKILATYTIPQMPEIVLKMEGLTGSYVDEVRSRYRKGDIKGAIQQVTDDMVERFALAGTPDECLRKLERYAKAGLRVPILYIHGPEREFAVELAGKHIVPKLVEGS